MRAMRVSDANTEAALFQARRETFDFPVVARFTIDGEPRSKARPRFTRTGHTYTPEPTRAAQIAIAAAFRAHCVRELAMVPDATYGVVGLFFCGTRQRRDVDNMLKLILDALTGLAWHDDSQVSEVTGRKTHESIKENARTEVLVYRLGSVDRDKLKCKECGAEFVTYPSWSNTRYCSAACTWAESRRKCERTCAHCGSAFTTEKSTSEARFCSRRCGYDARRVDVPCVQCGTTITKAQSIASRSKSYCSEKCRQDYWRPRRAKAARGTCSDCGGATSKKSYKRCRGCHIAAGGRWADRNQSLTFHIEPLEANE